MEALNNIRWRNSAFEECRANASNGKSTSDKTAVVFIVGNVFSWRKVRTFEYVQHKSHKLKRKYACLISQRQMLSNT